MLELISTKQEEFTETIPNIYIVGIGGCGCSAIKMLQQNKLEENITLVSINTDARALLKTQHPVQIGKMLTRGKGAGAIPDIGRKSALESESEIKAAIENADLIFIVFGMGGGTGTGAAPEVARIAQELSIPTLSVATRPFSFEGNKRIKEAELCLQKLKEYSPATVVLQNDQLSNVFGKKTSLKKAFEQGNHVLCDLLTNLQLMIQTAGFINIDFNDFKTALSSSGNAFLGLIKADIHDDIEEKIQNIIDYPLAEIVQFHHAKHVLVQIKTKKDMSLELYCHLSDSILVQTGDNVLFHSGLYLSDEIDHDFEIYIFATGIPDKPIKIKNQSFI